MSLALTLLALAAGLAIIISILFFGPASMNDRVADAVGLLGVALIGAAVALYVGHSTDGNAGNIARDAIENARTIAINNILAQVETVTDSHQGMRPCSRYLIAANLMENFVYNRLPPKLPDLEEKTACLAGFYAKMPQKIDEPMLTAVQWSHLREQVLSFLNVVELAADYSTNKQPLSDEEAQSSIDTLTGQQVLARYLYGMVIEDSKRIMRDSMPYIRKMYGREDLPIEVFWRVCKVVKCEASNTK